MKGSINLTSTINDCFYRIKPFIPRRMQLVIRRYIANRKRIASAGTWPIDQSAGTPPAGWGGWPDNKRFALVLQHDVETSIGHENCLKLVEMERNFGVKSCYYFVPERYTVSSLLREKITGKGFETGVHGLRHDGKLFSSLKDFTIQSERINRYIKEWGVRGFSSPSMYHNLSWSHAFTSDYEISTFDTDPFEPQSDGVNTIFPFKVESRSRPHTYIEIPYTLPQDHTLFVILRERDISIWKNKLDWIARQGGMAHLNTHPDYMNFDTSKCSLEQYPVHYYEDFLCYVRKEYENQFWQPLPREMAAFWGKTATTGITTA
jgi:hypothetical protein